MLFFQCLGNDVFFKFMCMFHFMWHWEKLDAMRDERKLSPFWPFLKLRKRKEWSVKKQPFMLIMSSGSGCSLFMDYLAFARLDSRFAQSLYLQWNLLEWKFFTRYECHRQCLFLTQKVLTWFLASVNQRCHHGEPRCSLIPPSGPKPRMWSVKGVPLRAPLCDCFVLGASNHSSNTLHFHGWQHTTRFEMQVCGEQARISDGMNSVVCHWTGEQNCRNLSWVWREELSKTV